MNSMNDSSGPSYTSCDEIVIVAAPMLNSRRAFRAQSQLVGAIRCAGKAHAKRCYGTVAVGAEDIGAEALPWDRLQSAYGRIMVSIPEGHTARSRVARLDAGQDADTIYVGVEDLDTGTVGSKFVALFSARPAEINNLPLVTSLPSPIWQAATFSGDTPLSWVGPTDASIETLAVLASLHAIDCARDFDTRLGIDVGEWGKGGPDGRRHVALDLRIDRLSPWPRKPGEQLLVYRHADLLEPDSGSHLYQFLIAVAETRAMLCRIVIHLVRIGPRDDAKRPWGTIAAHGAPTKPQDVRAFFSYPSIDFWIS